MSLRRAVRRYYVGWNLNDSGERDRRAEIVAVLWLLVRSGRLPAASAVYAATADRRTKAPDLALVPYALLGLPAVALWPVSVPLTLGLFGSAVLVLFTSRHWLRGGRGHAAWRATGAAFECLVDTYRLAHPEGVPGGRAEPPGQPRFALFSRVPRFPRSWFPGRSAVAVVRSRRRLRAARA
ncbi:MAG TPA: hypothetical protein VGD67_10420, partial [Pseudonocardiaceae bacterium]